MALCYEKKENRSRLLFEKALTSHILLLLTLQFVVDALSWRQWGKRAHQLPQWHPDLKSTAECQR